MKSEELFRTLGDIDDAFILEAEEDNSRPVVWKIVAAAAVAAVAIGAVWFTAGTLKRPAPEAGPPELAAPVVTAEPGVPDGTTPPDVSAAPDHTTAPDVSASPSVPDETAAPAVSPGPGVPDETPPPDVQPSDPVPVPSDPPVQPSPRIVPFEPDLPGLGEIDWPEDGPHEPPYRAEYVHNDKGDFIVFTCPVPELNLEPVVLDITGMLTDGTLCAFILDFLGQPQRLFVLQVYDDGTYAIYWDHDPYNDTEWWLEPAP